MPESIDFSKLDPTKLDEYRKADPAWNALQKHLSTLPTIAEMTFLGRMVDTFLFVRDLLDVLQAAGPQIVERKMHGIPEMVPTYTSSALSNEAQAFLTKAIEEKFRQTVRQYEPWLLNQGLVMLCSIFDAFWEHVVDIVFMKHPQFLYHSEAARSLHLRDVVALGTVEAVVADYRQRETRRFGFLDTDKRLNYLEKRCRIAKARVFDWRHYTEETQKKLSGQGPKTLRRIYDDRHAIVHNGELPITKLSELEGIKEFFDKITLNTALEAHEQNQVLRETDRFLMLQPLYERFKAQMEGDARGSTNV